MKVVVYPQKYKFKSPTIILGGFEVLHKGHKALINKAMKEKTGDVIMMLLRDASLLPKNNGLIITNIDIRLQQAANIGIDGIVLMDVNTKFLGQSGKEFIQTLKNNYGIKKIICGQDFKYGKLAKENVKDLKERFPNTKVVSILKTNKIKISTSIIKELIYYGDIDSANELLIYDWTTQGQIDHDWKYVSQANALMPQPGIYYIDVEYENTLYPALMHINLDKNQKIFLINENNNLMGRKVFIHWHNKIRPIIKNSNDGVSTNDAKLLKKIWIAANHK